MQPMSHLLKYKLLLLAVVFPVSFSATGGLIGVFLHNTSVAILFASVGLALGILLNIVCYSRKLFTIVLYQAPIPLALFLLSWWISNSFTSELWALLIGLVGLILGLWINQELILPFQFYKVKKRILALIYLFFSIASLGFFMGVPIFNILLGMLAGNYLSIRVLRIFRSKKTMLKHLKQGALYTAIVLFIMVLFASLLVGSDIENTLLIAQRVLHYPISIKMFYLVIGVGGVFIVVVQYFVTLFTAKTMLQLWQHRRMVK
jgi:hypothetical protein